jgi:hypothetical protein
MDTTLHPHEISCIKYVGMASSERRLGHNATLQGIHDEVEIWPSSFQTYLSSGRNFLMLYHIFYKGVHYSPQTTTTELHDLQKRNEVVVTTDIVCAFLPHSCFSIYL